MNFKNKKQLDNFIKTFHGDLKIQRDPSGYYYFYSNDDFLGNILCSLETTSVNVYNQNHLTIDQWENEIKDILKSVTTKIEDN